MDGHNTEDVNTLSIEIKGNVSGILGENGTEIECSYTRENVRSIIRVDFNAFNRSSVAFETIAAYLPEDISTLLPQGQYLKGRVTLTRITQSSTKAIMLFNKLMCIDGTLYKCKVTYTDDSLLSHTDTSGNMSIQVEVSPSKPEIIEFLNRPLTSKPVITEGYNVTFVCSGDVGRPPAKLIFQNYRRDHILPMNYTPTSTSVHELPENCSYYRTSDITFMVTSEDNQAVIQCIVVSSLTEGNMYVELAPLEVNSVIVVGTVCGSIIFVLCVILLGVLQNKNKTLSCFLTRNHNDRSLDYVNTPQQQDPSLYEGVDHGLDVHNYEQLARRDHLNNNAYLNND
ncbi:uncharacterized protein LOC134726125 [Mytilus trossulus]|uniref:uncharacterized protein LOC134726125 n=1 Tax=Mytilus trossulus TaxID=6551 RepID=UPI0030074786